DDILECFLVRQEANRNSKRFGVDFRAALARLAVVALRILRARRPVIAIRAIFSPLRLAWTAPLAITIAIPRPIMAASGRVRFFAFEIGIVVRTGRLIRPGGQHPEVEQVLGWRRRRH
ncbi:MAG TPA: hypothetical protein VE031_04330, partial [Chthoniobacterales bacterium]|nr:hypothetical protein [Chthoniobacterales bacterium]